VDTGVDLSIVIVNWNTQELLDQCLQSLENTVQTVDYRVWVVDNGSVDGSVAMVQSRYPSVHVIANSENVGFVRANNQALAHCVGRYVLLLNSDTQALPGSIDESVRFMDGRPLAGMVGVRLVNPDETFQASYTPFPTLWREFLILTSLGRRLIRPYYPSSGPQIECGEQEIAGYMEGAYLLARREALEQVGELDERIFMYAEDVDWCYRFYKAGWELWYLPMCPVVHYGGQSTSKRPGRMEAELYRGRVYFFRKHYGRAAALCLTTLIYALTGIKLLIHRGLRWVTRGRWGRSVASWREVRMALSSVGSMFSDRMAS